MLLTVPAHQWLWSVHDEHLHHQRRYSHSGLRRVLAEGGFAVERLSFFNTLLFAPAVAARLLDRWRGNTTASGSALPGPAVNGLLGRLFAAEAPWLRRLLIAVALAFLAHHALEEQVG